MTDKVEIPGTTGEGRQLKTGGVQSGVPKPEDPLPKGFSGIGTPADDRATLHPQQPGVASARS